MLPAPATIGKYCCTFGISILSVTEVNTPLNNLFSTSIAATSVFFLTKGSYKGAENDCKKLLTEDRSISLEGITQTEPADSTNEDNSEASPEDISFKPCKIIML